MSVPRLDPPVGLAVLRAVARTIASGTALSVHDLSEGGLAVAAAEMAFAGGLGATLELGRIRGVPRSDVALFSESPSRFLVEVNKADAERFEAVLGSVVFAQIGEVVAEPRLVVRGQRNDRVIDESIADLKEAWQRPLRW
ncbi:MAG: AIR synthase-related protein [Candidatus Rokuibacteriota bacterium]